MKRTLQALLVASFVLIAAQKAWAFDKALVDQFSGQVSQLICSDGGAWLKCFRMQPSACKNVADSMVAPCAEQILLPIKEQLAYDDGVQTAQRLMGCFNERFEQSYGSQRLATDECSKPPKHLRSEAQ
jgi:hypothetical protein